jgi:SAM-dependent methyltransferase
LSKVIVTAVVLPVIVSCYRVVTYVPTPPNVVDRMLELARVTENDVVYDLGSGDGRIVIAAAKKYGTRGVGIEISPDLVKRARAKAVEEGVDNLVRFEVGDVLKADFRPATVVTLYLDIKFNGWLRPVLEVQLKPGTRIVSHDHAIPGWEPQVGFGRTRTAGPDPGVASSETLSTRKVKLIHSEAHSMERSQHPEEHPHWHTIYLWEIE